MTATLSHTVQRLEIHGVKLHVIRLYTTFRPSSAISWGAWILLITYPCLALWFLGSVSRSAVARVAGRRRLLRFLGPVHECATRARGRLLVLNMIVGPCLGTYTGIFLSGIAARPLWHSGLLGPLFLISGVATGADVLGLFNAHHDLARTFIKWNIAAVIAESAFLAPYSCWTMRAVLKRIGLAAGLLLSGPYTGAFFGPVVLLAGIIAPLVMGWADLAEKAKAPLLAPALGLIGGLALRFIIVFAGQTVS